MEFVIIPIAILTAMFLMDTSVPTTVSIPTVPETTAPASTVPEVILLTEEEIHRGHMLHSMVLAAKFALRHNLPGGYARASAEMRKYV